MAERQTPSSPPVAIVGLGLVGCALAKRLHGAGYRCIGSDVRPQAMAQFAAQGHEVEGSVARLASVAPVWILAVFDTDGVLDVVRQIRSVRTQGDMPLTLIDCSTGDPLVLQDLAPSLKAQGIGFIEAPLSGSSAQIEQGAATLLLGGEADDIATQQPILDALATQRIHVGAAGMAARAKLATNLVLGLNRAALAEGMVFAESIGISPQDFLRLVLSTPARSEAAVVKGEMMVQGQFEPQSRIRQHLKDVRLMLDMAEAQHQNLPLSQTHAALMKAAVEAGDGELDNAAIIRQIRREQRRP
ncbi:MAG: 2-hydroxy-3-oxopropionate reductase [Pseudomonadota bacterium]|jgi:3-hydroxyisobutyrate dehydrogenase-like beta-hydroxyacid dehydrogenase